MIIRKKYRFEAAHIVRNCTSQRCRENIHGHSYVVEVLIKGDTLDDGCMLLDFSKLSEVKELIDSFDHSYCLWSKEDEEIALMIRKINNRIVTMPISPSAEGFALVLFVIIKDLIMRIPKNNGEGVVRLHSVRVHETETGYAEAFEEDLSMAHFTRREILFSDEIKENWKFL